MGRRRAPSALELEDLAQLVRLEREAGQDAVGACYEARVSPGEASRARHVKASRTHRTHLAVLARRVDMLLESCGYLAPRGE